MAVVAISLNQKNDAILGRIRMQTKDKKDYVKIFE